MENRLVFHPRIVAFLEKIVPRTSRSNLDGQEIVWLRIFREMYSAFGRDMSPQLTPDESLSICALAVCELHEPTTTNVRLICRNRHVDELRRRKRRVEDRLKLVEYETEKCQLTISNEAAEELANLLRRKGKETRASELIRLVYVERIELQEAKRQMGPISRQHYYEIRKSIIQKAGENGGKFKLERVERTIPNMEALQMGFEIRLAM